MTTEHIQAILKIPGLAAIELEAFLAVANLKAELEAEFKNPSSPYLDERKEMLEMLVASERLLCLLEDSVKAKRKGGVGNG